MLKSRLCDLCDRYYAYILVKERIMVTGAGYDAAARQADERNKGIIFKTCTLFIIFKSEIINTEIDNAIDIDIVMPIHNLIEYSDNHSKTSGSLCYKDEPNDNF